MSRYTEYLSTRATRLIEFSNPCHNLETGEFCETGGGYAPDATAPDEGEYVMEDGNAVRWRQSHRRLVHDALSSWKGDPIDMFLHMSYAKKNDPQPSSGGGKQRRAQAEALLWEIHHHGKTNTKTLYRGAETDPKGLEGWSELKSVAKGFQKKGHNANLYTIPKGEAKGIKISDYVHSQLTETEREWIIDSTDRTPLLASAAEQLEFANSCHDERTGQFCETGEEVALLGDLEHTNPQGASRVREALKSILKVHSVPADFASVLVQEGGTGTAEGLYVSDNGSGNDAEIRMSDATDQFTFAHEFGHHLTMQGERDEDSTTSHFLGQINKQGLGGVFYAITASDTIKRVNDRALAPKPRSGAYSAEQENTKLYAEYLMRPQERFARAYAQYISIRSGNKAMRDQMERFRFRNDSADVQWTDSDFEPIAKAFDNYFANTGLTASATAFSNTCHDPATGKFCDTPGAPGHEGHPGSHLDQQIKELQDMIDMYKGEPGGEKVVGMLEDNVKKLREKQASGVKPYHGVDLYNTPEPDAEAIKKTIDIITAIHPIDPTLQPVRVSKDPSLTGGTLGAYKPAFNQIGVQNINDAFSLVHELGHWQTMNPNGGGEHKNNNATEHFLRNVTELGLGGVQSAITQSVAIRNIANRIRKSATGDPYDHYLLSPHEAYARAYAQYIATRSQDPTIKAQFEAFRTRGAYQDVQWSNKDFELIAKSFDEYYAAPLTASATEFSNACHAKDNGRFCETEGHQHVPSEAVGVYGTGAVANAVRATLQEIDKIHGYPNITLVPVKTVYSKQLNGQVKQDPDGKLSIEISENGTHKMLTFAHEFGHILHANNTLPKAGVKEAIFKSFDYRQLVAHKGGELGYVDYLLDPNEAFARAYAQYVATKSQNSTLLQQVDGMRESFGAKHNSQWSEKDFEPIAEEFDKMFAEKGLLKHAVTAAGAGNPDALRRWYNDGAKGEINWGAEGDLTRCHEIASKYMDSEQAWGFCERRAEDVYGESNRSHDIKAGQTPKAAASLWQQRRNEFYNQCHQNSGEDGGRFCETDGGDDTGAPEAQGPNKALKALGQGKTVNLKKGRDVRQLLDKLANKSDSTKTYDLCNVQVDGQAPFCKGNLGIARANMPQLNGTPTPGSKADKLPKSKDGTVSILPQFLDSLNKRGIRHTEERVQVSSLQPTQNEIDARKAASFAVQKHLKTIIISSDNHVLDGHHHWAAAIANDYSDNRLGDTKVNVIRIDAPISKLLKDALLFDKEWGITGRSLTAAALLTQLSNECHDPDTGEFCDTITGDLSHLTSEHQKIVHEQIKKIPADVRRILAKQGVKIVSKDKVSRTDSGRGLDYGGVYNPRTHEVEVSNRGFEDLDVHEHQGDANFVLHEFGHAFDYALGRPSQHAAFRVLWKDAKPRTGSYYQKSQSGSNPREEMLAEAYAHVWQGTEPKEFTLTPSIRQIATELRHNINTGKEFSPELEAFANACHDPETGEFCETTGTGTGTGTLEKAPASEQVEARNQARQKISSAPVPSAEDVTKKRAELERLRNTNGGRAGGEFRGNVTDRKNRQLALWKEFGGPKRGYVVDPATGVKMHWTKDRRSNKKGYPLFTQGKIFTAHQGGGYKTANLIPELLQSNQQRGDTPIRHENLDFAVTSASPPQGGLAPADAIKFYNHAHDPATGRFTEGATGSKASKGVDIEALKAPDGGATIDSRSGQHVRTGYAVAVSNAYSSITPTAEFFSGPPGQEKGRQILKDWIKKHKALFQNPAYKIGLWHDSEHHEMVIDVSEQVHDRAEALKLGRERDQQGIYDLHPNGEGYIDTGGSGGREEQAA